MKIIGRLINQDMHALNFTLTIEFLNFISCIRYVDWPFLLNDEKAHLYCKRFTQKFQFSFFLELKVWCLSDWMIDSTKDKVANCNAFLEMFKGLRR